MKYEIKQEIAEKYPVLIDLNEKGQSVNLHGVDVTVEIPGAADAPPKKRVSKGATQADLAHFFKNGHPFIIQAQEAGK